MWADVDNDAALCEAIQRRFTAEPTVYPAFTEVMRLYVEVSEEESLADA